MLSEGSRDIQTQIWSLTVDQSHSCVANILLLLTNKVVEACDSTEK